MIKTFLRQRISTKNLAKATWSILKHNPINIKSYLVFLVLNILITCFYSMILLQRLHFSQIAEQIQYQVPSNITIQSNTTLHIITEDETIIVSQIEINALDIISETEKNFQKLNLTGAMKSIRSIDYGLLKLSLENSTILVQFTLAILIFITSLLLTIFYITAKEGDTKRKELQPIKQQIISGSTFNQIICSFLITIQTFLNLPLLDIIIRTLYVTIQNTEQVIFDYFLCIVTFILYGCLNFYINRLFNLNVPTADFIPWCSPIAQSKLQCMTQIYYVILIGCIILDPFGIYIVIEVTCCCLMAISIAIYRLYFIASYNSEVGFVQKSQDFILCLIFYIGIVCKVSSNDINDSNDLVYLCIFTPLILTTLYILTKQRGHQILNKDVTAAHESIQLYFMTLMEQSIHKNNKILDLIYSHKQNGNCKSTEECLCLQFEKFLELKILLQKSSNEVQTLNCYDVKIYSQILNVLNASDYEIQEGISITLKLQVLCDRYLIELIYSLFMKGIISKNQNSSQIQLYSYYFTLIYREKPMLTLFQMRLFQTSKLSAIDRISFYITETYLLSIFPYTTSAQCQTYKLLILSQVYTDFTNSLERLTLQISNLWDSLLPSKQFQISDSLETSTQIAKFSQEVFFHFSKLSEERDPEVFWKFAMALKLVMNDQYGSDLLMSKVRSMVEIKHVYQNNFTANEDCTSSPYNEQTCFVLANANGSGFGQILTASKSLRQLLGWNQNDQHHTIQSMMPHQIANLHSSFIQRFYETGKCNMLKGLPTKIFLKKKNGYIIPVQMQVTFNYSVEHDYTFLVVITPIQEMTPFIDEVRYPVNQLHFLIVDDEDIDSQIINYSQSWCTLVKDAFKENKGVILNILQNEQSEIQRRISDLIPDIQTFGKHQNQGICELDLTQLISSSFNQKQIGTRRAAFKITEEIYASGLLKIKIYCFLLYEQEEFNCHTFNTLPTLLQSNTQLNQTNGSALAIQQQDDEFTENNNNSSSSLASGSTASTTNSFQTSSIFNTQSSTTKTPKIVSNSVRLLTLLYLLMMLVASLNLWLTTTQQKQAQDDITTVKASYDRLSGLSSNLVYMRSLLNIANGYEQEQSDIYPEKRFYKYQTLQTDSIQSFKDNQTSLEKTKFVKSTLFEKYLNEPNIPLQYLTDQNEVHSQTQLLNIAFNTYIAKLIEINKGTIQDYEGDLSIQKIGGLIPGDKITTVIPNQIEKTIFFIAQNGIISLRRAALEDCFFFARESEQHAQKSINTAMYTCIFSIISIVVISLLISPLLTRADIRRHSSILLLQHIPQDQIAQLTKNCQDFMVIVRANNENKCKKANNKIAKVQNGYDTLWKNKEKNQEFSSRSSEFNSSKSIIPDESSNSIIQPKQKKRSVKHLEASVVQIKQSEQSKDILLDRIAEINNSIFRRRSKLVFLALLITLVLCLYFLASFYLTRRTFLVASQVISSLEIVFQKSSCFDFAYSFIRANQIRNFTLQVRSAQKQGYGSDPTAQQYFNGSDFYIDMCMQKEQEYLTFRMQPPSYFQQAQPYMSLLESSDLCTSAYPQTKQHLIPLCRTAMDGLLKQGLSITMGHLLTQLMKINMNFHRRGENYKFNQTSTTNLLDFKVRLLTPILAKLNSLCMSSANQYIESINSDSLLAYLVFSVALALTMLAFVVLGVPVIRSRIRESQLLLRLMFDIKGVSKEIKDQIKEEFSA